MDNLERIRTVSRKFRTLCGALFWLTPFGLAGFWLAFNHLPESMVASIFPAYVDRVQPLYVLALAFAAGLIPAGAVMYALAALRGLFSLYMRGMIFTGENVRCFRRAGLAFLWWAAASFIHTPLSSVIMTQTHAHHWLRIGRNIEPSHREHDPFDLLGHGRRAQTRRRPGPDHIRSAMPIVVNLDVMLARRKKASKDLAEAVGITPQNLSILKTGKAKAIRFSTLEAICRYLDCSPGDILEYRPDEED